MKNFNMNNFEGVDACIETSLYEYGLAWIYSDDQKEVLFYYGICMDNTEYNVFDFCSINIDIDVYQEFDFANFDDIYSFTSMSKKEWSELSLHQKIFDLISYYGYENIFGSSHWSGLKYNANINRFHAVKND